VFRLLKEPEQGSPRAVVSGPHNGTVLFTARLDRHGKTNPHGGGPECSGTMQGSGIPGWSRFPATRSRQIPFLLSSVLLLPLP
jgi:hypothetical protein